MISYFLRGTLKDKKLLVFFHPLSLNYDYKRIVALEDLSLDERYELINALFIF